MKKYLFLLLLSALVLHAFGQENYWGGSYNYVYAPQWDNAFKTYNFSRPDLAVKQPLFVHGLEAHFGHQFTRENSLTFGYVVSYSYMRSQAENVGYLNALYQHLLHIGFVARIKKPADVKGIYSEFRLAAVGGILFRNVNGLPFLIDDKRGPAPGVGGEVAFKIGYLLPASERVGVAPFVIAMYCPFYFSPRTEAVINQTRTLSSKTWTAIFTGQIGITFHLDMTK